VESGQLDRQASGAVVLGMHRSGTSAFSGLLVKAGFFAGKDVDLLPAAKDNPVGFFERFDVNDLNNELLAEMGGTWDSPPPRTEVLERASAWRSRAEEVLAAMAEQAGERPLVIKDPRMSLLLPTWLAALGDRFVLVLVDRNPIELAMSMRKRDGRPLHVTLALWQLYYADLLKGLAGRRVWFARYESLVQSPAQYAAALLDALQTQLASNRPVAEGDEMFSDRTEAVAFVIGELHRQRAAPVGADGEHLLTSGQRALSDWLYQLPEGWVTLDPPATLCSQPNDALASATAYHARTGEPAPTPVTARGAVRLAHHHYLEGGVPQVVRRAATLAFRLVRQR
jgi:hypothetical protein